MGAAVLVSPVLLARRTALETLHTDPEPPYRQDRRLFGGCAALWFRCRRDVREQQSLDWGKRDPGGFHTILCLASRKGCRTIVRSSNRPYFIDRPGRGRCQIHL